MKFAKIFLVILYTIGHIKCEKILFFFPISTKSQTNIFEPLIRALSSRGHKITIVTSIPYAPPIPNTTEHVPIPLKSLLANNVNNPFDTRKKGKLFWMLSSINLNKIIELCDNVYENSDFKEIINAQYDLVIYNGFMSHCFEGILAHIKAPYIYLMTIAAPSLITEATGNFLPLSYVPDPFLGLTDRMSFLERVKSMVFKVFGKIYFRAFYLPKYENLYRRKLGQNLPGIYDIQQNMSLTLMYSHFSLNFPRPNLPDNVEVGGMHCRPSKKLPSDLDDFLSGAEDGFIFFSLGSVVQAHQMARETREIFLNVFRKLKQRVIWKWETEQMEDLPQNVKLSKWLPQQDILGHPNIKLFMTHGGLLSTQEAAYHGVPLIGIPIFGDQDFNMMQAEAKGYALTIEILDLTEEDLMDKITKILTQPKYSKTAKELSDIIHYQTETPVERAVFWTEYVMRHRGATHLRSEARKLNYFQANSFDTFGFIIATIIVIVLASFYLLKMLIVFISSLFKISTKNNKTVKKSYEKKLN